MDIYHFVERKPIEKPTNSSLLAKYAPRKCSDIVCNDMSILLGNQWFKGFRKGGGSKRFMLVSGPSGIGKSSLVRLLSEEHGYIPLEILCSCVKTHKEFDAISKTITPAYCLIVDEVDTVEGAVLTDVKDLAKKMPRLPIVFICTKHTYGKPVELCKVSEVVSMKRPNRAKLVDWTRSIIAKENICIRDAEVEQIVDRCRGDVRQILLTLEVNRYNGVKDDVFVLKKDPCIDATNVIEAVMMGNAPDVSVSNAMRMCDVDPSNIITMAAENYLDIGCKDFEKITQAADAFSMADILENDMYMNQNWESYDSWLFMGATYPMMCMRTPSTHSLRFTKLWSKTSNMFMRMGQYRELRAFCPSMNTIEHVYALSSCMHACMEKEGIPKMVAQYAPYVRQDLAPFVLRLSSTKEIKQTQFNKIRQAYLAAHQGGDKSGESENGVGKKNDADVA